MTGFDYQTVTTEICDFAAHKCTEYVEKVGEDYGGGGLFFESYPFQKIIETPYDGTAFANRGEHFNCTVCMRWSNEGNDEWIKAWIKEFVRDVRAVDAKAMQAEGKNLTHENSYVNFHLPDEPVEKAFRSNLPR